MNDLWAYDGSRWSWLSGSNTKNSMGTYGTVGQGNGATVPSARKGSMSWTRVVGSTVTLYIFGGYGLDSAGNIGNYLFILFFLLLYFTNIYINFYCI